MTTMLRTAQIAGDSSSMTKRTWFSRSSLILSAVVSIAAPAGKMAFMNEAKSCKKATAPLSSLSDDSDVDSRPPFGSLPASARHHRMGKRSPGNVVSAIKQSDSAPDDVIASAPEKTAPGAAPTVSTASEVAAAPRYEWKKDIATTVFWVGELPTPTNPTPNHESSWDANWARNYGGFDNPDPAARRGFLPAGFTPRQNPFYIALPYNDICKDGHKEEASKIIPWFKKEKGESAYKSVCKGRWIAIRKGDRVCYAQWEDAGPFTTTDAEYVFGDARPQANVNNGAGLDVSPAVRDYLGLDGNDMTDWKFVEFDEIPLGPWAEHGDNNDFVMNRKTSDRRNVAQTPGSKKAKQPVARARTTES